MESIMKLNAIVWLTVFVGGVIMLIYGLSASQSFASDISNFFSGTPTEKSMWLIIGGAVLIVIGLSGLAYKQSRNI